MIPVVRVAPPLLEARDVTKVTGTRAGCVCFLNPFNAIVAKETGSQTPSQMGKNVP